MLLSCSSIFPLTREWVKSRSIGCHNLKLRRRNSSRHIVEPVAGFQRPRLFDSFDFQQCDPPQATVLNASVIKGKQRIKNLNVLLRSPCFDDPGVCFAGSRCNQGPQKSRKIWACLLISQHRVEITRKRTSREIFCSRKLRKWMENEAEKESRAFTSVTGLVTKEVLSARYWGEKRIQDGGLFARVFV